MIEFPIIHLMMTKHLKIIVGILCVILAIVLFFRTGSGSGSSDAEKGGQGARHTSDLTRSSRTEQGKGVIVREGDSPREPRSLNLPALTVDEKRLEESAAEAMVSKVPRSVHSDDDILAMGGVVPVAAKSIAADPEFTRLKSIKSEDWKGAANLLVNALREGDGFEVNHDELIAFISGKDLLGWPVSLRNWIGDELMTALRQDRPGSAFEDLKSIVANTAAPAAMRDYSVQHITHLVTGGVIGKEGADYIWQTLEKNDPQTLGTSLISLHRLSQQVPDLISAKDVQVAAERLRESPDERTRITAESILKEGGGSGSRH